MPAGRILETHHTSAISHRMADGAADEILTLTEEMNWRIQPGCETSPAKSQLVDVPRGVNPSASAPLDLFLAHLAGCYQSINARLS